MNKQATDQQHSSKTSARGLFLRWVLRVGLGILLFFLGLYAGHYLSQSISG